MHYDPWLTEISPADIEAARQRKAAREVLIAEQAAEITRLRAACDAYFRQVSLMQMKHARHLPALERRIARQRRALAKLYERRHDKNAALATAQMELEHAARQIDCQCGKRNLVLNELRELGSLHAENVCPRDRSCLAILAATMRAAAKEGES